MFNTPILDIAIGLVFIFLLYSLLATSIKEAIAAGLSLRARMLKKGIVKGMLTDCKDEAKWESIRDGLKNFFEEVKYLIKDRPKKQDAAMKIGDYFYDHPIIKNYGSGGVYRLPSYIPTSNFSTVLIDVLKKDFDKKVVDIAINNGAPAEQSQLLQSPVWKDLANATDAIKINELLNYYARHFNVMYYLKKDFEENKRNIALSKGAADNELLTASAIWKALCTATNAEKISELHNYYTARPTPANIVKVTEIRTFLTKVDPAIIKNEDLKIDEPTLRILRLNFRNSLYSVEQFGKRMENWFDESMERVSGWYKRQAQYILFFLGICMAVAFNIDTIAIAKKLSQDKSLRDEMVNNAVAYSQASKSIQAPNDSVITVAEVKHRFEAVDKNLEEAKKNVNSLLALGWQEENCIDLEKVAGFLIFAFAISLGAPFWFDMLNKIISIRGTGKQDTSTGNDNTNKNANAVPLSATPQPQPMNINVNAQNKEEAAG